MPKYIRPIIAGDRVFFTVSLADRRNTLLVDHVSYLREAVREVRYDYPFDIMAWVVLPNHLHAVWQMPSGDCAYGQRWGAIKSKFTRALRRAGVVSREEMRHSKETLGHAGIWQPRFSKHCARSDAEVHAYIQYCWEDPARHGLVNSAHDWPYSSIHRDMPRSLLAAE